MKKAKPTPNCQFICSLLGILIFSIISCTDKTQTLSSTKPNIIIILADDMSYYDLSGLGQEKLSTPNIDKLLQNGLFFNNAYAGSSECAPSRGSLLTGKNMGHCRIRLNSSVRGQEYLQDSDTTIAEMLKSAGYKTGTVGKWGVGLPGTEGTPNKQGFDYSCGFYDQLRAHTFYPFYLMENDSVVPIPENYGFDMADTYLHNKHATGIHSYTETGELIPKGIKDPSKAINSQDFIHQKAINFIHNNYQNPFSLYYATQLPHGPVITPSIREYMNKPWDQKHKEWAAMMGHLDRCVGDIVKTIDQLGLSDNTIIFFASDNGYAQYGYFHRKPYQDDPVFRNKGSWKGGKFIPLDGGVRIPFLVNWPGKINPGISDEVVTLYDLLATSCDLAGVKQPENDGKSLVPLLNGEKLTGHLHKYLYWEGGTHNKTAQSVRYGNWFAFSAHPDSSVQLWDVSKDTSCMHDLASENTQVVDEAIAIFNKEHTPSEWYVEPGEDEASIQMKRQKMEEEGGVLKSIKGNSIYPWKLRDCAVTN